MELCFTLKTLVPDGQHIFLLGSDINLGAWKIDQMVPVGQNIKIVSQTIEYKYLIFENGVMVAYECDNHVLVCEEGVTVVVDELFRLTKSKWIYQETMVRLSMDMKVVDAKLEGDLDIRIVSGKGHRLVENLHFCEIYVNSYDRIEFEVQFLVGGKLIAKSFANRFNFTKTKGVLVAQVVATNLRCIGQFSVPYFVVEPLSHPSNNLSKCVDLDSWRKTTFFIGHRGMGISNSLGKKAPISENTVLSLQTAAEKGADFVEFDVNLTKDKTALIYHDFMIGLELGDHNILPIPIQDIDYQNIRGTTFKPQVHMKRFGLDTNSSGVQILQSSDSPTTSRRGSLDLTNVLLPICDYIPTLRQVFEKVPVGFDVEIKFPLHEEIELYCLTNIYDHSVIVDEILKVCFDFEKNIFFSTFEPEIACLVASKQVKYPVFFLTEGGMTTYKDERCNSIENAIKFCLENSVHGIVTDCRPILKDTSLIKKVIDAGLLLMAYGTEMSDPDHVKILMSHGIHGVICDGVGHVIKTLKEK